ncbi:MAG TPA: hypothetical protein VJH24_01370 [Candidatus Bilamarchaeaceae archaeon]|nr:hypothetical protein [Candidatus Bilamarchaeaceae archaeon]
MRYLLFAITFLFFIAGCTAIMQPYVDEYEAAYRAQQEEDRALFDATLLPLCAEGECVFFVCDQTSQSTFQLLGLAQRTSLEGATCEFRSPCGPEEFNDIQEDVDVRVRPFAIGQGTGFGDFADAQSYCQSRLDMPVKWLYSPNSDTYPLPRAQRAACFLDKETMPLYILYSGGKTANVQSATEVADALKAVGPVIITTEMDVDVAGLSDAERTQLLNNVEAQAISMKITCPDCLIALGVRMGDTETLDALLSRPAVQDNVDLIAFGINTHYSNATCNPASSDARQPAISMYVSEVYPFARKILYEYNKSSVIAYALFDTGATAATNPDGSPSCIWDTVHVQEAQRYLFDRAIQPLVGYGAIGFAPYAFSRNSDNPLNCRDCQLAEIDVQGQINEENERFLNWFSFCQSYKASVENLPLKEVLVLYSTQPGTVCSITHNNFAFYSLSATEQGPYAPVIVRPELQEPVPPFIACDACVFDPDPEGGQEFPFSIPDFSHSYQEAYCDGGDEPEMIQIIQAIDRFADKRDLDPMLVRAMSWQESGFDRCVSTDTVPIRHSCNPYNIDNHGDLRIFDPLGCDVDPPPSGQKFCTYGLMQSQEYPGDIYQRVAPADEEPEYPDRLVQCAAELNLIDDEGNPKPYEYNPFDSLHSVCVGTLAMQEYLQLWTSRFDSDYHDLATLLGVRGTDKENERNILATYFALHRYNGGGARTDWLERQVGLFVAQRGLTSCSGDDPACTPPPRAVPSACVGNDDFMDYIRRCRVYHPSFDRSSPVDYGSNVLGKYEALRQECGESNCPSYRRLQQAIAAEGEEGGIEPAEESRT